MPWLVNEAYRNFIGIKTNIFNNSKIGLAERGLLITLMSMYDKNISSVKDIADKLPDDETFVENAMQVLIDEGYVSIGEENGEKIISVSDESDFLEV